MKRAMLMTAALAACAPQHEETLREVEDLLAARHHPHALPRPGAAPPEVSDRLRSPIDAGAAVSLALSSNREVRAILEELGIAEADLWSARLPPNPVLSGGVFFPVHPGEPGAGTKLEGSAAIDLVRLLILSPRRRAAESRLEVERLRAADRIRVLLSDVKRAFYTAVAAEEALDVQRTVVEAAEAAAEFSARQKEAGNASDLEASHHAMALKEARLELARIELARSESRAELARLIGAGSAVSAIQLMRPLPPLPAKELDLGDLLSTAMRDRLDLRAASAEVVAAQRALTSAEWGRLPAIYGGAGAIREIDGHLVVGPMVQVGLPIFDRNQGEVARAEARIRTAEERQRAVSDAIAADVASAGARLAALRSAVEYYLKEVLPLRMHIVDLSQRQYNQMQLGVFELLRARKSETEARRQSIEALRDYWRARIDVEQAAGSELGPSVEEK